MIGLFIVSLVAITTARTAAGRNASPWLFGSVSLVGWLLLQFGLANSVASVD